jgi:hypothetical protein
VGFAVFLQNDDRCPEHPPFIADNDLGRAYLQRFCKTLTAPLDQPAPLGELAERRIVAKTDFLRSRPQCTDSIAACWRHRSRRAIASSLRKMMLPYQV